MNIEDWKSQIKRGTLEYCILLMISKKAYYGYEIISELEKLLMLAAKESTIYPLLRRLLKDGLLSSYWQDTAEGLPPRKYYTITEDGKTYLTAMSAEWQSLLQAIAEISDGTADT
ncbi:MAG: PadR family transcriptional regulator [Lachnospiraceae bacterium]|nr:PadR family transcriptional regulator [Lachnospiraceae bacterium]